MWCFFSRGFKRHAKGKMKQWHLSNLYIYRVAIWVYLAIAARQDDGFHDVRCQLLPVVISQNNIILNNPANC